MELYNSDCLLKMKDIPSKSVDLIICDLPFGCLTGTKTAGCTWDVKINLEAFWKEVRRIRKNDHTPTIHFCTTKFGFDLYASNPDEFRYDLVWAKPNATGFLAANKMPMRSHEMMYVFSKAGATYERIDISGDFPSGGGGTSSANFLPISGMPNTGTTKEGSRCVKSWIFCSNKKTKGGHPTAKPLELYKFLIERYCPSGGTVLDPTFGSCTSGLAARELQRKYIGIEMNKEFFDKAKANLVPE
jgi:DNA modification methylase